MAPSIDKKQKTINPCYISNLPDDILQSIFCILPISTFLRCSYVCKSWRHILSSPNFVDLHGGLANVMLFVQKDPRSKRLAHSRIFRLLGSNGESDYQYPVAQFTWSPDLRSGFSVVGSCNGLLCVGSGKSKKYDPYKIWILNPITGEYVILPPHHNAQDRKPRLGFGFCPKLNQYKVISIYGLENTMQAEVYTLGVTDGKWRNIGVVIIRYSDEDFTSLYDFANLYVNGSFHWLMVPNNSAIIDGLQICALDFESEQFRFFSLPSLGTKYEFADLGVIRNSLYFCCFDPDDLYAMDVWVMNKYGVEDSWTKMLAMDFTIYREEPRNFDVIKLLENGNSVLLWSCWHREKGLFSYNLETKLLDRVYTTPYTIGGEPIATAVEVKPSFASLEDVVGDKSMVLNGFV